MEITKFACSPLRKVTLDGRVACLESRVTLGKGGRGWCSQLSPICFLQLQCFTGFARVLENLERPGIVLWNFPGLENPGKVLLVLKGSENL